MSEVAELQEKIRQLKQELEAARLEKADGGIEMSAKGTAPINPIKLRRQLKGRKLLRRVGRARGVRGR